MHVVSHSTYPLGVVQAMAQVERLNPAPFSRLLIGCPTAGLIAEADGARHLYSPLDDPQSNS